MLAGTVLWLWLTCYALFAGADFRAGAWDLLAGGAQAHLLIEHSIGPGQWCHVYHLTLVPAGFR